MTYFALLSILFTLLNFHLLRNISSSYLSLPAFCYFALLLPALRARFTVSNRLLLWYFGFFWWSFYVAAISFLNLSVPDALAAIARFFFVFPIGIFAFYFVRTDLHVRRLLITFVVICAIGCLTIPLQFIIGPISWFAEASTRSGFERYASLFGNLTAVGVVGAFGLIATLFVDMPRIMKFILSFAILSGMLLSLQKAAILNLFFIMAIYLFFSATTWRTKLKQMMAVVLIVVLVFGVLSFALGDVALVGIDAVFRVNDSFSRDDYSVSDSLAQRLWEFPLIMIDRYGIVGMIFGIGLKGGGGTFGIDSQQSHNSFFDLLFMGGVPYLLIFLGVIFQLFKSIMRARFVAGMGTSRLRQNNLQVILGIFLIFTINLPFMTGAIFQPNIATIIWTIIGLMSGHYFQQSYPDEALLNLS
jgi:hypothetical protein